MLAALQVVHRGSLSTDAADILRRAIFSGRLAAGARLNEARLSAEIGVSRGPLREALRTLEQEGVVVSSPHRGTYVATATAEEFAQVVAIRERIEPFVIEQALRRDRDALLRQLRDSISRISAAAKAGDSDEVAREHTAFHAHFYRLAGGIHLRLWERLEVALSLYVVLRDPVLLVDVPRGHEEMLRLVELGDMKGITRELNHHLSANFAATLAAFERPTAKTRGPRTRTARTSKKQQKGMGRSR
jgi:DNA-binding GntR family transcriptional regulator